MHPFSIQKFRGGYAVAFNDKEGNRRRYSLKAKTKKDATPEALEVINEFFKVSADSITIRDIIERYAEHLNGRPSGKRLRGCTAMVEYFGGFKPRQLTDQVVNDFIAGRVSMKTGAPVSNETLWTELGLLRDAISYAEKRKIIPKSDVPFIPRPSKPAPRDRPLTRPEVGALLREARKTPHLYIAILLLLGTAGRVSAVLELEWDRVDFVSDTIDLRTDFVGPRKGRAKVPMNPFLRDELLKWKEATGASHVVTYREKPVKSIKTAFSKAVTEAKLEDVRVHDLRHTAAVWMLEAGSSIDRISQYLGHSNIHQTFKVYARYQPDFLRPEAASLDVSDLVLNDTDQGYHLSKQKVVVHRTSEYVALTVYKRSDPDLAAFVQANSTSVTDAILALREASAP